MSQLSPEQLISRYDLILKFDDAGNPTGNVLIRNSKLCIADDAQPVIRAARSKWSAYVSAHAWD